jgi:DNA-binding beta-propeller fold protein YncE
MSVFLVIAGSAAAGCGDADGAGDSPPSTTAPATSADGGSPAPTSGSVASSPGDEPLPVETTPNAPVGRVTLPTNVVPVAMAAGFGSLWVSDHDTAGVYRIDPATNEVVIHIDTHRGSCLSGLTVVVDEIWQSTCGSMGSFIRIDPLTNQVIDELPGLNAVASLDNEVWATDSTTSPGAIVRLDPTSYAEVERMTVGAGPGYLAVDEQSVWVVNNDDRTVTRFDKASRTVTATIPLGEPPMTGGGAIAIAGGAVWVDHLNDGSVYRIDPESNTADRLYLGLERSGHYWEQYLHGSDIGVWVRVREGLVVQLDPQTGRPITGLPVDPGGGDMEVAFGSLWVNGHDGVQRFAIG